MKKFKDYNKYTSKNLKGNNIYRYKNSKSTIYYDNLTKTPYIISDQDALFFQTWQLRLPLCLMGIGLIMLFTKNLSLAVGVGAGVFVVSSILFRVLFLNKLPVSTSFKKPESKGLIKDLASKYTNNSLILIEVLFVSMGLSLLANQILRPIDSTKKIVVIVLIVVSLLVSLFVLYIIRVKKKEKL